QKINDRVPWSMATDASGQKIHWTAGPSVTHTRYQVELVSQAMQFEIDPALSIPNHYADADLEPHLQATDVVQVGHPEIVDLWNQIKPEDDRNLLAVLRAIFDYTYHELDTVPFKGTTDALTALRLGIASCNGKSRLFVTLARMNHIPARLVGGMILDGSEKRTSHQWVEVYVEGQWVPFGPTNGHFAYLPENYLKLYTGDHALIRHTANIDFDYYFTISKKLVPPIFYPQFDSGKETGKLETILSELTLTPVTMGIILAFPICCLLITLMRNVVGIKTYGIFMPMLIAATCVYTGLVKGTIGFLLLLVVAWAVHWVADKLQLLKTARLALVVTVVICSFIGLLIYIDGDSRTAFGMLAAFPVIIIGFIADRLHQATNESQWQDLAIAVMGTSITVLLCYLIMKSMFLQGLLVLFPELLMLIIAAQIYLGQWSGLRLSEEYRFGSLLKTNTGSVLGINSRNRDIIYKHNDRALLRLAADKLGSKQALQEKGIPVAENLAVIANRSDIEEIDTKLAAFSAFAIKPNQGSQGKGILVLRRNYYGDLIDTKGNTWACAQIKQHLQEILSGSFSQNGDSDIAYVEPLIEEQDFLYRITKGGLSDIRIILGAGKAVSAMLRMPTQSSSGKANLHQGAIGAAIRLETGETYHAQWDGSSIIDHPDSGLDILGLKIPEWGEMIKMAEQCYSAIPLNYLGVDICLDRTRGPLVLEVNGRPGLEIQNVTQQGMSPLLRANIDAI
ncbi:MAG: sugar-transfer associated ATP-grasp domain-containing protein, partial [Pseudomonadota bacterium]